MLPLFKVNLTLAETRLFGTFVVVSVRAPQPGLVVELPVKSCQFNFYLVVSDRAYTIDGLF